MKKNLRADRYFSRVRNIQRQIEQKEELAQGLREQAEKMTARLSPVSVQSSADKRVMADNIEQMSDLLTEIELEKAQLLYLLMEVRGVINAIDDPDHRFILEMVYLNNRSFAEIGGKLNYSVSTIKRKYHDALNAAVIPETPSRQRHVL